MSGDEHKKNNFVIFDILMLRVFILISLLFNVSIAWSFQCSRDQSLSSLYEDSERIFLIYITETKLEESLVKRINESLPKDNIETEDIKLLSSGYRVIENFKGDIEYIPRLIDLLGIGTGYVGLVPGSYYLVMLPEREEDLFDGMRMVNICTVPFSHYRLEVKEFQDSLNIMRNLMKK